MLTGEASPSLAWLALIVTPRESFVKDFLPLTRLFLVK